MNDSGKVVIVGLFLSFLFPTLNAQDSDCKVLLDPISDHYEGECKRGLAHGEGIAMGTDTFRGEFKKGLPHGDGRYTWENGDYYIGEWKKGKRHGKGLMYEAGQPHIEDPAKEVVWRKGEKVREVFEGEYSVQRKRNVPRTKVELEHQRRNAVEVNIKNAASIEGILVNSSSGSVSPGYSNEGRREIDQVDYPVTLLIEYTVVNRTRMNRHDVTYEIELETPGFWRITLHH